MNATARAPDLTVVMVTYGARAWVERAIAAVRANTDVPYQLVVVDNASPDDTAEWLRGALAPDELLTLDVNVGYAAGNDLGVNRALAPAVCLLNSDAIVPPGWASALLAPLATRGVAAAVPLYVEPDGTVQEAGCNVAADAVVTPLGRGDDADSTEQMWPRVVQHASAACLVVRTRSFRAVGGFDAGYGLGYYEDVELVAALQARGESLVLVPTVRVLHAHAASAPDQAVADARVAANRPRFVARHRTYLAWRHHAFDLVRERHRYYAARDAETPERVLVIVDALSAAVDELPVGPAPARRVTVVVTDPATDDGILRAAALRAAGVEVLIDADGLDPSDALTARLLQLSTVHARADRLDALADQLDATQPHAARVALVSY